MGRSSVNICKSRGAFFLIASGSLRETPTCCFFNGMFIPLSGDLFCHLSYTSLGLSCVFFLKGGKSGIKMEN